MTSLALFDFDGTLTTQDSYTKFLLTITPKWRLVLVSFIIVPVFCLYKTKLLSATKTRKLMTKLALYGRNYHTIKQQAQQFQQYLEGISRPSLLNKLRWHQQQGHEVVIVSASLDIYLKPWCDSHQVACICSELVFKNNRFTGSYHNQDCCGSNKVNQIKAQYQLADYQTIYAYGDTLDDFPMLTLADKPYYQNN